MFFRMVTIPAAQDLCGSFLAGALESNLRLLYHSYERATLLLGNPLTNAFSATPPRKLRV